MAEPDLPTRNGELVESEVGLQTLTTTISPTRATVLAPPESVRLTTITQVILPLKTTGGGSRPGLRPPSTGGTYPDISPYQTSSPASPGVPVRPTQNPPRQNAVRPQTASSGRTGPVLASKPTLRSGTRNTNIPHFLTQIKHHSGNRYTALLTGASLSSEVRLANHHRPHGLVLASVATPNICVCITCSQNANVLNSENVEQIRSEVPSQGGPALSANNSASTEMGNTKLLFITHSSERITTLRADT